MEKKYDFKKDFALYNNVILFMKADVPIETLCLPKIILNVLHKQNFKRVSDLIGHDLSKIKGLGIARGGLLASSLDKFLSVRS